MTTYEIPRPGEAVRRLNARRHGSIALAPLVIAAAAFVLVMVTHLLAFGVDHLRVHLFDAGLSHSWSYMVGTATVGAGTVVAAVAGCRRGPRTGAWRVTAGLMGFLFLDRVFLLHDHVAFWPVVYAPVLIGLLASLWRLAADTDEDLTMAAGMVVLGVSLAINVLGPGVVKVLGWGPASWGYEVKVGLKHATELAGWLLIVAGLWRLRRRRSSPAVNARESWTTAA